jgi:hypothetical protein
MTKESIRTKVVNDVKAAEKAIITDEKMIANKIKTKMHAQKHEDSGAPEDQHIPEEM